MASYPKQSVQTADPVSAVHLSVPNRQPLWQGPPPPGVDKILKRDALAEPYANFFAGWASHLALVTSTYVMQRYQHEAARIHKQFGTAPWIRYKAYGLVQCDVGPHVLWIKKQVTAWSIETRSPRNESHVLSISDMPILCHDEVSAARLALACYPETAGELHWRPHQP
jgi:hypothetical protein